VIKGPCAPLFIHRLYVALLKCYNRNMSNLEFCSLSYCDRPWYVKDWCKGHYEQYRTGKAFKPIKSQRAKRPSGAQCDFHECDNKHHVNGLCSGHDAQRRRGKELRPLKKVSPKGTWHINSKGYMVRQANGKNIFQHREVMSECLGRELLPHENVHHKNGDRTDNRVENLELWSKLQPPGQRVEDKLKWAYEIIELYGPKS